MVCSFPACFVLLSFFLFLVLLSLTPVPRRRAKEVSAPARVCCSFLFFFVQKGGGNCAGQNMMRSDTAAIPSERFKRPARIKNNNSKTRHKEVDRPQLAGEKGRGRTNKEEELLFFCQGRFGTYVEQCQCGEVPSLHAHFQSTHAHIHTRVR